MTRKGELAKLAIKSDVKELIADQIEGLSPADLPDNLEQMARFEKDTLGVNIASCGTFHVIDGFAKAVDDKSNIEDFVTPLKLPQAAEAILSADKIHIISKNVYGISFRFRLSQNGPSFSSHISWDPSDFRFYHLPEATIAHRLRK